MNKGFLHTNIVSSWVLFSSQCDLENIIKADLLNCRSAFIVYREHSPANFHSDCIEQEITLAESEKTMSQKFHYHSLFKCMLYLADNIRPHENNDSAINLTLTKC